MKGDVLTPRQRAVLRAIDDTEWRKASDVGASSRSHHSQTLRALVERELAESHDVHSPACKWPGEVLQYPCEHCRGYRLYRRTASGKRALAELATSRDVRE